MTNIKLACIVSLSFSMAGVAYGQDCKVITEKLVGTYEGGCVNGKAEGAGKANGTDRYEGEFKNGYPHGKGIYYCANGDRYDGNFNKGQKEGSGTMIYRLAEHDSIVNGFWKKNQYAGKYEEPYKINSRTIHVTGITCKLIKTNPLKQVDLFVESESGGLITSFASSNVKPELSSIQLITGTYQRKVVNDMGPKRMNYVLEDVTFPFRAILTMGNDAVEIELLEEGRWTVNMRLAY